MNYLNLFQNEIFWKWFLSIQNNYFDFYKFIEIGLTLFGGLFQNIQFKNRKRKRKIDDVIADVIVFNILDHFLVPVPAGNFSP